MKQFKNFLLASCVWALALSGVTATRAFADESVSQVALNAQQKQAVVKSIQVSIARHQKMTVAQIIADLQNKAAANRAHYAANAKNDLSGWDKATAYSVDQLKAIGDKDVIIAMETAQLQQVMTSDNLLFGFTRWNFKDCEGHDYGSYGFSGYRSKAFCMAMASVWSIFLLPVDLIVLPFSFIGSLATGF